MKLISMADRKEEPPQKPAAKPRRAEAAFEIWLQRGLHLMFDDVAREPVPDELLRLIEDDRKK